MAKSKSLSKKRHDTGRTITTKSAFGSHREMVVNHEEYGIPLEEGKVLLQDGPYFYVTYSNRLDNGLADPERYSGKQLFLNKITQE